MSSFSARLLSISRQDEARRELLRIGVDPVGVDLMAPKMMIRCVHLSNLQCPQANIIKQEMLSLGGDAAVGRGTVDCSIETTDAILIGTEKQLLRLCGKLVHQPFNLAALSRELSSLLAGSPDPRSWKTARRDILLERPIIMGILNITPDSFSDGGSFLDPQKAVEQALKMEEEGADIIDIGGESTRPGAPAVTLEEESRRVIPVIEQLSSRLSCPISVDTWKSTVAQNALSAGAEIINDISGFTFDPDMAAVAARNGAGVVLMHTRGTPDTMQKNTRYDDVVREVSEGLRHSLEMAVSSGVEKNRIVVDPGIGFGKDVSGNLEILRRLREFTSLGAPLLIGTSRKFFIGKVLGRETSERLIGTAATVALAIAHGASIFRVHDVREMRDAADMAHAIVTG